MMMLLWLWKLLIVYLAPVKLTGGTPQSHCLYALDRWIDFNRTLRNYSLTLHLQLTTFLVQDSCHSYLTLNQHKSGHNQVSFTNVELKFDAVVVENHSQHTPNADGLIEILQQTGCNISKTTPISFQLSALQSKTGMRSGGRFVLFYRIVYYQYIDIFVT